MPSDSSFTRFDAQLMVTSFFAIVLLFGVLSGFGLLQEEIGQPPTLVEDNETLINFDVEDYPTPPSGPTEYNGECSWNSQSELENGFVCSEFNVSWHQDIDTDENTDLAHNITITNESGEVIQGSHNLTLYLYSEPFIEDSDVDYTNRSVKYEFTREGEFYYEQLGINQSFENSYDIYLQERADRWDRIIDSWPGPDPPTGGDENGLALHGSTINITLVGDSTAGSIEWEISTSESVNDESQGFLEGIYSNLTSSIGEIVQPIVYLIQWIVWGMTFILEIIITILVTAGQMVLWVVSLFWYLINGWLALGSLVSNQWLSLILQGITLVLFIGFFNGTVKIIQIIW